MFGTKGLKISGVRRMWTLGGGCMVAGMPPGEFLKFGYLKWHYSRILTALLSEIQATHKVIWINKNNCKTLLFIFTFLSSRGYWVEKSLNTFVFKNINLSMLEVWIDSEIQIHNNNNNQTNYYRSWRMWFGGRTRPLPPCARHC